MGAAIMMESSSVVVNVQDMQCAQALAQVNLAMKRLEPGFTATVICDRDDVVRDLLAWAKELRHAVAQTAAQDGITRITLRKHS